MLLSLSTFWYVSRVGVKTRLGVTAWYSVLKPERNMYRTGEM